MTLQAFIKDLSEVDDNAQGLYKKLEDGSGYIVDVAPVDGFSLENISQLKGALHRVRDDYDKAKQTLKSFGDLDPTETLAKLERYEQIKDLNKDKLKKELASDLRTEIANEFKGKLTEKDTALKNMTGAVKKAAREKVMALIAKAGGTPEFALPYIEQYTDVEINDNGFELKILDDKGEARFDVTDNGDRIPYSAEKMVEDLQKHEVYGKIFPSSSKPGSGGPSKYGQTNDRGVKLISPADKHKFQEEIAAGTVEVDYG